MKEILEQLTTLIHRRGKERMWKRIALVLSTLIIFCTMYVLIVPALTLSTNARGSVIQEKSSALQNNSEPAISSSTISKTSSVKNELVENVPTYGQDVKSTTASQTKQKTASLDGNKIKIASQPVEEDSHTIANLAYTFANITYADFSSFLTDFSYDQANFDNATQSLNVLDLKLTYHIFQSALVKEKNYHLSLPDDSTIGKDIELGKVYTGRDGNGIAAFTYAFHKDESGKYEVLISFLDSYVSTIAEGADSKGFLTYDAIFGTDYKKSNGSYVIAYSDDMKVTINPDKVVTLYDLNVTKKAKVSYEGNQPYISYTVTIFSENGSPAAIDLSDILTANGISINAIDQVSVRKGSYTGGANNLQNLENISSENYAYKFDKATNKLDMTLQPLNSGGMDNNGRKVGQAYEVNYRYKLSDLSAGKIVRVDNKATATSDNGKKDGKKTSSGGTSVELKLNDISKSSQGYDPDTGMIKWSVTVNPDKNDIAGALLTDTLFDRASELTFSTTDGYTIEKDKTGKLTGIRFKAVDGKKNTQAYTITYKTKVDLSQIGWSDTTIKNTVTLDNDGNPKTVGDQTQASASQDVAGTGSLHKSQTGLTDTSDEKIKELSWQSDIKVPTSASLPAGTIFTDVLTSPWVQDATKHWYTTSQLQLLYRDLVKIFSADGFTLAARQNNWEAYTSYANLDAQGHFSDFKIILTKPYTGSDFSFTYHSMVDVAAGNQFKNMISSGTHTSSDDYHYQKNDKITKMDGNENDAASSIVSEDGIVTWKVKVMLSDDAKRMTIIDNLPENVDLVDLQYGQHWGQITAPISGNTIASGADGWGTYNIGLSGTKTSDGKITLNFTSKNDATLKQNIGNNNEFWLTFKTKYTKVPTVGQVTVGLNNIVSGMVNGSDYGSSSQKQTVTVGQIKKDVPSEKVISKSGQWDNDNRLASYSVDINPQSKILAGGADALTVTDTLSIYGTDITEELLQSSVKLLDSEGKQVDASKWSWRTTSTDNGFGSHTHTLALTIKNGTKYTLSYQYKVTKTDPATTNTYWAGNTAKIEGTSDASSGNTVAVNWQRTGTNSGIETERVFTINKVETNNFGVTLPNATFTVYEYNIGGDTKTDKVVTTYKTNGKGSFNILFSSGNFSNNKVYYVVETAAPNGYKLSDNPSLYYFYFKGKDGIKPFLPADIADLSEKSKTIYIENEKLKTATIKVDKKWLAADGTTTELVAAKITVNLLQVSTSKTTGAINETKIDSKIVTKADNWTTTFVNLPVTGVDSKGDTLSYMYKVIEEQLSGYQVSYSNMGGNGVVIPISSGDITVTNQVRKSYLLPKTGGKGINYILIIGTIMTVLSCLLLAVRSYKAYLKGGGLF